LLDKMI